MHPHEKRQLAQSAAAVFTYDASCVIEELAAADRRAVLKLIDAMLETRRRATAAAHSIRMAS